MNEIVIRRREYLEKFFDEFNEDSTISEYESGHGSSSQEVARNLDNLKKDENASKVLWGINHSRLVLGKDVDKANRYFETVSLSPCPAKWMDGKVDTADWDFMGTRLLKTVLDFNDSCLLSQKAKKHLRAIFINWKQPRPTVNKDNNLISRWPVIHTENHDIMCLTIGLFGELFAGRDVSRHIQQLSQSLTWRFERGWVEWHSPSYQIYYLNPLLILARHAPSLALRNSAKDLINLQMAERALLSVNGYLGGPFYRGYDQHIENDRSDCYLPIMWMAFGLGECQPESGEGVEFAVDSFQPESVICSLAAEAASRPILNYRGARFESRNAPQLIYYYNTPHISMGSKKSFGYSFQSRYFNVMFALDPSKSLRTYLREPKQQNVWDTRNERGEVAQYRNWLISHGALVEEGGIAAKKADGWDLYRVGKGLCAHFELADNLHIFQVSDLDTYPEERTFLAALSKPVRVGNRVRGKTTEGEEISVELADMSLSVNSNLPEDWSDMLHDCPSMRSRYGSGLIEIKTGHGSLVIDHRQTGGTKK